MRPHRDTSAGRLVEMGTIADMRHLSALTVEASFDAQVPDITRVPGVSMVEVQRLDAAMPGAG